MVTAAKITDREGNTVTGEYWENNHLYNVEVEKKPASGYLHVEVYDSEFYRKDYIDDRLDMHEVDGSRARVALEGSVRLPEKDTELEALARTVLQR